MPDNDRPITKFCECGAFIGIVDADGRVLMGGQWVIYGNSICSCCSAVLVWRSGEWRRARMEAQAAECIDTARVMT